MRWPAQQPSIPDPSIIKDLSPPVQILFLVLLILSVILFYFGSSIREAFSKRTKGADPAAPPADPPPAQGPVRAEAAALQNTEITDRYIASLERRIAQLEREVIELRDDNDVLRRQIARRERGIY